MRCHSFVSWVLTWTILSFNPSHLVNAQPSPELQKRITAAIADAKNATGPLDYTKFVNVFIGTDNDGGKFTRVCQSNQQLIKTQDVCPGASIPFGMTKFTTDMTGSWF